MEYQLVVGFMHGHINTFRKGYTLYARYLCSRDALGRPSAARDDRVSCIQGYTGWPRKQLTTKFSIVCKIPLLAHSAKRARDDRVSWIHSLAD